MVKDLCCMVLYFIQPHTVFFIFLSSFPLYIGLRVANLIIIDYAKKAEKILYPWLMGAHLLVLSKSFPMSTNMTGLNCFLFFSRSCALEESS